MNTPILGSGIPSEANRIETPFWKSLANVHQWLAVLPNSDGTYVLFSEAYRETSYGSNMVVTRVENVSGGPNYVFAAHQPLTSPLWLDRTILIWSVIDTETTQIWSIDVESSSPIEQFVGCIPCVASSMKVQRLDDSKYGIAFETTVSNDNKEGESSAPKNSGILHTKFPLRFEKVYRPEKEAQSTIFFSLLEREGTSFHLASSPALNVLDGLNLCLPVWPDRASFVLTRHGLLFSTGDSNTKNAALPQKKLLYLEKDWLSENKVSKVSAMGCETWTGDPHSFSVSEDGLFATFLQYQSADSCFDHDSVFIVDLSTPEQSHRVSLFRVQPGVENSPWNPRILSMSWSSQTSSALYAIIDEDGSMSVWRIDLETDRGSISWKGLAVPVIRNGCVSTIFPLTRREGQESILLVRSTFDRAGIVEIASLDSDYQTSARLIAEHCVPSSSAIHEKITFQGAQARVSAFIHKPGHFASDKKYPVIIMLHGGPNDAWRDCWPKVWNPKVWTDQGYVVVTPNISGSTGYGLSFATSIYQDWGGRTLTDIECLFSYMETSVPFVDLSRVIGAGYSFGGYMMNWIAGNSLSARFRALIVHAGLYSTRNLICGDLPVVPKLDFGCFPWEDAEKWERWDASRLCQNWKTPMFFSHGEIDYRIPISESLAAYNTCQIRGVPSQFLVFREEGHTISKPGNLTQFYEAVMEWTERWLGLP